MPPIPNDYRVNWQGVWLPFSGLYVIKPMGPYSPSRAVVEIEPIFHGLMYILRDITWTSGEMYAIGDKSLEMTTTELEWMQPDTYQLGKKWKK